MTRHYSPRDFFRNTPNAMLARYFAARGVLQDFDFAAIKETKIEPLFEAWLAVPETQRAKMEVDLREIGDMSNEKGVKAIIDEAEFHLSEDGAHETFVAMLMALPGHHERAMTTFLDHPALWKGATRLYHADTLSHWRKRKNLPKVKAATEPADIEALSAAIKSYYQITEGRAKHCRVEPYRRGELEYFFAFPEDYAQNSPEWEGDELALQSRHPPFEIVFVWDAKDGRLELHLTSDKKAVEPLQGIFAETILKCKKLLADPTDNRVYDLFPLRRKEFSFTWNPASGIKRVAVNSRFRCCQSPKVGAGDTAIFTPDGDWGAPAGRTGARLQAGTSNAVRAAASRPAGRGINATLREAVGYQAKPCAATSLLWVTQYNQRL